MSPRTAAWTVTVRSGAMRRERRVLLGGRARERELGTRTAQRQVGVLRDLDPDRLFGQLAHDLEELLGGDGDTARLSRPRRDACCGCRPRDRWLPGRAGPRPCALHFEQHVREDRHRVALLDDRLDARETTLELRLRNGELHRVLLVSLFRVSGFHEFVVVVVVRVESTTKRGEVRVAADVAGTPRLRPNPPDPSADRGARRPRYAAILSRSVGRSQVNRRCRGA